MVPACFTRKARTRAGLVDSSTCDFRTAARGLHRRPRVTGSIAAYKSADSSRGFRQRRRARRPRDDEVRVDEIRRSRACSRASPARSAERHVGSVVRRRNARRDRASAPTSVVVAPATADLLARLAQGRADDLVTSLVLSRRVASSPRPRCTRGCGRIQPRPRTCRRSEARDESSLSDRVERGGVRRRGRGAHVRARRIADADRARADTEGFGQALASRHGGPDGRGSGSGALPRKSIFAGKWDSRSPTRLRPRGAKSRSIAGPVSRHAARRAPHRRAERARDAEHRARRSLEPDAIVMAAAVADYRPKESDDEAKKRRREANRSSW